MSPSKRSWCPAAHLFLKFCTNWRTDSREAKSRCITVYEPFGIPSRWAAFSALAKSRQAMITCQSPLCANALAAFRPRPEEAPAGQGW